MSALLFVDAFRFVQDFSGFLHLYWKYILHKPFELQFAHHILVVLGILAFDVGILHILIGSHPRKQPPLNPIHRIGPKLPPHYRNQCSYFPPTNPSCLCQAHPFWWILRRAAQRSPYSETPDCRTSRSATRSCTCSLAWSRLGWRRCSCSPLRTGAAEVRGLVRRFSAAVRFSRRSRESVYVRRILIGWGMVL